MQLIIALLVLIIAYQAFGEKIMTYLGSSNGAAAAMVSVGKIPGAKAENRIVVYGRSSCGNCAAFKQALDKRGTPYSSRNIDDPAVYKEADELLKRAGLGSDHYSLPIVTVNGKIFIEPEPGLVLAEYKDEALDLTPGRSAEDPSRGAARKGPARVAPDISVDGTALGNPPMAIINGEVYNLGSVVSGFTVQRIGKDYVVFVDKRGKEFKQLIEPQ